MALATQTITVDLKPHYNKKNSMIVYCSQYDNDLREVVVNVKNEGVNVDVSAYTIYVEGTKPDNKGFSYELTSIGGTVVTNVVTFPLQTQMTAAYGIVSAELVFYSGDNRIGSANFILAVEQAGLEEDIDVSETDIPAYIAGAQTAAANAEADALVSEGYARGSQNGVDVTSGSTYYENNSKYYKEQAETVAASIPADYTTLSNDVTELKSAIVEDSPNMLNLDTLVADVYINNANGQEITYAGWSASDYIEVTPNTDYIMLAITSSLTYAVFAGVYYAFYDSNKQFKSGGVTTAGDIMTAPSGAKYLRVSLATSKFDKAMVGKYTDLIIYANKGMHEFDKVGYGDFSFANKLNIIRITEPFVFYQWNGACYFKFNKIYYVDFDGETKEYSYTTSFARMYSELIVSTNTSRVQNCCSLASGYTFIYSVELRRFIVVASSDVTNKDVIMLACDSNGLMSGLLFDEYNAQQCYYTARQVYKNIPANVLNQIDNDIPSGVYGSATENFTFANVADNHSVGDYLGIEANFTALAIDHVDKQISFDAIVNCGDEILTSALGGSAIVALSESINAYDVDKLVFCEGNHDRGIIDPVITHKGYYNLVLRKWRNNANVHTVYPKSYYYRDFPAHKIRTVCLTAYDMPDEKQSTYPYDTYYGYTQEQMVWLRDVALQIDSDWSVIIVDHTLPVTSAEGMTGNGTAGQNPLVLRQLLESFKDGTNVHLTHTDTVTDGVFEINMTTQFDGQGARTLIGVFGGHTHIDTIVAINGITYVATCCGYIDSVEYSGNRGNREGLTYSAICFDIGRVNTTNREVTLNRIGFVPTGGSSVRTFTY